MQGSTWPILQELDMDVQALEILIGHVHILACWQVYRGEGRAWKPRWWGYTLLNRGNTATCSVMSSDVTIRARYFSGEIGHLDHCMHRIKQAQQKGNHKMPRLWAYGKDENLGQHGLSRRQRCTMWMLSSLDIWTRGEFSFGRAWRWWH